MAHPVTTTGPIPAGLVVGAPSVGQPRWAPGGSHLGWVEGRDGRGDVVVASSDGSGPTAVVTGGVPVPVSGPTGGGTWCWAGPEHVIVADVDGRLVVVPLAGGPGRVLCAEGRACAPAMAPATGLVAFVWERDDACDVAVVDLAGADDPVVVSHADVAWDPLWAPGGGRLAWHEWDLGAMPWEASRLVVADRAGEAAQVVAGGDGRSVGQPRFSPDGAHLAWVDDASGWMNVTVADGGGGSARPLAPEPYEHAEPSWGPGQRSFAWSPDSRSIAWCRNEAGFGRLVVASTRSGAPDVIEVAKGWHHGIEWGSGGILAARSGARTPPEICVTVPPGPGGVPAHSGRRVVRAPAPAELAARGLVEPEPVTWPGADGASVFGLLYRPLGSAGGGPPPLLVDVHGGPTGQATAQWRPFVQYLVSRGWAVLAPDFRGSTGHGRAYARAISGQWGVLDVDDCAAAVRAATARGWGDAARVAVCGGSAGALSALLLAAHHGSLVRAVAITYGVTDLLELAATTHRLESRYLDDLVGTLPAHAGAYRARSPVAHVASIQVPTLVLHGDADRVVTPAQADALVEAIRAAGGVVEHHVYPGEGHGWTRAATALDAYERIEVFLARWVLSEPGRDARRRAASEPTH